jgi:hypothetical protein
VSLQELGSIGEFVGGLAVLVSLVYLALQIRHNTASVRAATSASICESLSRFTELLSSQPELARVWYQGRVQYDSLNEEERHRLRMAVNTYLRRLENAFYQQTRGFVDPDHWQTTERQLVSFMSHPGALRCWSERKSLFSDRFVEFVERHISDAPAA